MKALGLVLGLGLLCAGPLVGQTAGAAPGSLPADPAPGASSADHTPLPYKDDEFPPWVLKLRRFEIIAVGAFPLVYLFTSAGYDYGYYAATGFSSTYIPWPVGQGTSQWTTTNQPQLLQTKNIQVVTISIGVSLILAGVDWFLGL